MWVWADFGLFAVDKLAYIKTDRRYGQRLLTVLETMTLRNGGLLFTLAVIVRGKNILFYILFRPNCIVTETSRDDMYRESVSIV